jgi:hypothetical protein
MTTEFDKFAEPEEYDTPDSYDAEYGKDVMPAAEREYWDEWEMKAEQEAERAAERYFEEGPHGGTYAGSEEEARDRYLDGLLEQQRAEDWRMH